jgi:NAD(P)-dependent dehydrogenase (short-subunit alcohol dehydrogenase family)
MAVEGRVAFVTGASRGIGRGCALHLARAGFDVVIAARTVKDDERPQIGNVRVPGSLEATAAEVEELGRRACIVRLDLLDRSSLRSAVETALAEMGRVDVLVNNAIYGSAMRPFEQTPIEEYERAFAANVVAPMELVQLLLPHWKELGGAVVIDLTSGAGHNETAAQVGEGGWPLAYSLTKAAFNRLASGLAKELKRDNIAVVNLEPGFVATEQMTLVLSQHGIDAAHGLPVDVPGAACAYVAGHPTPMAFSGRTVDAPQLVAWLGLVDVGVLPHPYGPSNWGFPPRVPIGGHATGVESNIP